MTSIGSRALRLVVVVVLVTLMTSLMLEAVPGSAAQLIAGEGATPEAIAAINQQYGFDRPLLVRYVDWLGGLFTGDLGNSYRTQAPVWQAIVDRAPVTLELAVLAVAVAILFAIPIALWCAYRAGGVVDRIFEGLTSILVAVPWFLSSLVLAYVFSVTLGWLPVTGWTPFSEDPLDNLTHAIIPVAALALPAFATFLRVLRADALATLRQDHVALARAKGVAPARLLLRHTLRPSSFSLLTVAGLQLANLVGATAVIETLFAIPGLGSLLVQSVLGHDMVTVQGVVVVIALVYLLVNVLVDVSYRILDPRVAS